MSKALEDYWTTWRKTCAGRTTVAPRGPLERMSAAMAVMTSEDRAEFQRRARELRRAKESR